MYGQDLCFDTEEKVELSTEFCGSGWRFDWYEGTFCPDYYIQEFQQWAEWCCGIPARIINAKHGYEHGMTWDDLFMLWWGGYTGKYGPHFCIFGGDECESFTKQVRMRWPDHSVSRVDVCVDFLEKGGFENCCKMAISLCKKFGVQTLLYGDWVDAKKGRTLYCGSKQSTHQIRIYEKGHEMRAKGKQSNAPLEWFRVEIQVRPARQKKRDAARLSPEDLARSSRWTAAISQAIGMSFGRGVSMCTKREKSLEIKAVEHMLTQYASTLQKVVADGHIDKSLLMQIFEKVIETGVFRPPLVP